MRLPNFLIIGAQKCGTTALYDALCQHPEIYMSPVKEPFYFVLNGAPPLYKVPSMEYRALLRYTAESYAALFAGARGQRAIGEASALYLSSYQPERTAANIQAFNPQMRLIALLRQPTERAWSAFQYYRAREFEPVNRFQAALAAEATRRQGNDLPDLRYFANGCYFANLKPYFDRFPREQIRVYLYEEWNQQPQALLRDLFAFLGVDETVAIETQRKNVTFHYRHAWLQRFLDEPNAVRQRLELLLRGRLRTRVYRKLRAYNQRKPPTIDAGLRRVLTEYYRSDIEELQHLINRDLSHWLTG
ncbi:MAG: sulfotransferase domain-containing protein [Caldilineaceae bacterium]